MENLKEKLNNKLEKEYDEFIGELKQCKPEVIIERAYEKVTKGEMVDLIKNKDLESTEIKALLKTDNILSECYDEWLKCDGNFNEILDYAVDERIESITDEYLADCILKIKQRDCR